MATIFSRIAAGEIPSYKVAESPEFYAFLDINPLAEGHTLVIPRHIEDFARKVAAAQKAALPCKRVGVAVLGLEVPHTHIHLVPLQSEADMDFRKPKLNLSPERMKEIADSILSEYEKL